MSAPDHSTPSLTPFRDAFAQVLSELQAIPEAEVLGLNMDLPRAVTIALGALKNIASHREAIASALPTVDLARLDKLETYALAAAHAHAAFMAAREEAPDLRSRRETNRNILDLATARGTPMTAEPIDSID